MTLPRVGGQAYLDLSQWNAQVDKVVADAAKVDAAISSIIASFNSVQGGNVDLNVDFNAPSAAEVAQATAGINIPDETVNIVADVNDNAENAAIGELNADFNFDETVDVVADAKEETATQAVQDIENLIPPDGEDIPVAVEEGQNEEGLKPNAAIEEINKKLATLTKIATIQFIMQIASEAIDFFKTLAGLPIVGDAIKLIVELDASASDFQAMTGDQFDAAKKKFTENLLRSGDVDLPTIMKTEQLATQLGYAGKAWEDLVSLAVDYNDTFHQGDVLPAMEAADLMVKNNLVPDLATAMDVFSKLTQQGVDTHGGMMGAISDAVPMMKELHLTTGEMFTLLKSGWDTSRSSAGETLDTFKKFGSEIRDPKNADLFKKMGLGDEKKAFDQGKLTGGQLINGILSYARENPGAADEVIKTLFGARAGMSGGVEKILGLDATDQALTAFKGTMDAAAKISDDTLESVMTHLTNTLNVAAEKILSSKEIDLPGKLKTLKDQVTTFADELNAGAGIGGAIEIAFHLPGFEAAFNQFESTIGNIFLDLLGTLAKLLDIIGQGEAAKSLRATQAAGGATQLKFDVQQAKTEQDVSDAIQRGISHGVESSQVGSLISDSINEELGKGNVIKAQAMIDAVASAFTSTELSNASKKWIEQSGGDLKKAYADALAMAATENQGAGIQILGKKPSEIAQEIGNSIGAMAVDTGGLKEQADKMYGDFQTQFNAAVQAGDIDLAKSLMQKAGYSATEIDNWMKEIVGYIDKGKTKSKKHFDEINDKVGSVTTTFQQNAPLMVTAWTTAIDQIVAKTNDAIKVVTQLAGTAAAAAQGIPLGGGGGPKSATPTTKAGGGRGSGWMFTGEQGPELEYNDSMIGVLNAQSTRAIVGGLQALLGGKLGINGGNNSNTVINNNVVLNSNSKAQDMNNTLKTGRAIRGYGTT